MKLSFDRYEEEYLVFVDDIGTTYDYLKSDLKENLCIGDIIEAEIEDGKIISFVVLANERKKYEKENMTLMEKLKMRKKNN